MQSGVAEAAVAGVEPLLLDDLGKAGVAVEGRLGGTKGQRGESQKLINEIIKHLIDISSQTLVKCTHYVPLE